MTSPAVELMDQVRLLYNRLVEVVHELHGDSGVSAPQRAVLEYLHRNGAATVPAMARARNVTRQHIQAIVNDLGETELVSPEPNPAHQRSPLITLTAAGRDAIEAILFRECEHLETRVGDLAEEDLRAATQTLAAFRQRL
jgi:DNA-binding MarR family transcriptional regulator